MAAACSKPAEAPAPQVVAAAPSNVVTRASTPPVVTGNAVETAVPLEDDGGTFVVPVTINNTIELKFTIDSGAADVAIPADVVSTLVRSGTITQEDFIANKTFVLADGSTAPSAEFRIRTLKVGTLVLHDVTGSVSAARGSLLLGQSFLARMATWSIDNGRHVLMLKAMPGQAQQESNSTLNAAQSASVSSDGPDRLLADSDLAHMAAEFKGVVDQTGMSGVSGLIEECYKSIPALGGDAARKRATYCVTLDLVGLDFDAGFRRAFAAQTSKVMPPVPYYEDSSWKPRMATYLPLTTVGHTMPDTAIFRSYANAADKKLNALAGG
jgi:clan AA aspartic protease (TIGR02281 family)